MKNNKLFTLIELIVVIAILSILSILAFLSLNKRLVKSRNSVRLSDTNTISKALIVTAMEKGKVNYPIPSQEVPLENLSWEIIWYQWIFDEKVFEKVAANLSNLPKDPLGDYYGYTVLLKKSWFEVIALLEDDNLFWSKINQSLAETDYRIPYTLMYHDHLALPYKNIDIYSYTYNGQILTKNILWDNAKLTLNFNEIMEINVNHPLITGSYKAINILSFTWTNSNNILLTKFKPALPSPKWYYAISLYTPLYPLKDEDLKQIFSPEISKLATMFTGNDCNPENIVIDTTTFNNGNISNYSLSNNTIYKASNGTYEVLNQIKFGWENLTTPRCTAIIWESKENTIFLPKSNWYDFRMSNLSILSTVTVSWHNVPWDSNIFYFRNSVLHNNIIKNNTWTIQIMEHTYLANNYIDNTRLSIQYPLKIKFENNFIGNTDISSRCYSNCEQYGYIEFINNKLENIWEFDFNNISDLKLNDLYLKNNQLFRITWIKDIFIKNLSIVSWAKIEFRWNDITWINLTFSDAVNYSNETQFFLIPNLSNSYLENIKINNISWYNRLIEIQDNSNNLIINWLQINNITLSGSYSKLLFLEGDLYLKNLKVFNNKNVGYIIERLSTATWDFILKNIQLYNNPGKYVKIQNSADIENLIVYDINDFVVGRYYDKPFNISINNCLFFNIKWWIYVWDHFDYASINNCIFQNYTRNIWIYANKNLLNNIYVFNSSFFRTPIIVNTWIINNLYIYNYEGSLNIPSYYDHAIYWKLYIFDTDDIYSGDLINTLQSKLSTTPHPDTWWWAGQLFTGENLMSCEWVANPKNKEKLLLSKSNNCSDRWYIENFYWPILQIFFWNNISNQVQPYKRSWDQLIPWWNWDPDKKIWQW